ncbi:MAG: DUF481 domain-containing protein [Deltaproteobacteria bacterium]|nr:DUF481 domain-containing protein [Deltaproteobacteria bacterium]
MKILQLFAGLAGLVLVTGSALADDPKFVYGKVEEVKDVKRVEWKAAIEAGIVFTTGNSETTTATGGLKASRKSGNNKLTIEGGVTYARSGQRVIDDKNGNGTIDNASEIQTVQSVTAENLTSKLRYDRFLTTFNSLFVAGLASRDIPAGKAIVLGAQLGYSRQLHKSKTSELVGEFGYDYSHEDLVSAPSFSIHSARVFLGLKAVMTEGTDFDASLEALTNLNDEALTTTDSSGMVVDGGPLKDTRVNLHIGVNAKIGKNLAFQTTLDAKFDNRPAPLGVKNLAMGYVPEATSIDTIMKASLIYSFF